MDMKHLSYDDVLKEAQALGYAEADPTADVEGFDAAYKLAILATISLNKRIKMAIIIVSLNNSASFNVYPSCWGTSFPKQSPSGYINVANSYFNSNNEAGTFSLSIYSGSSITFDSDNYWNYVDVVYFYE